MQYEATIKYLRISTRKVRLVTDAVKKLSVDRALAELSLIPKHASGMLTKAIMSAVANAKQKNADVSALRIERIEVMGGPAMKRFHAVSRGMAHAYKKRMTHVRVVLTDEKKETVSSVTPSVQDEKKNDVSVVEKQKEPKGSKDQKSSKKKTT